MWMVYAFGSALFAGLTSILAKSGIRRTDSHVATAIRTGIVLVFAWGMVFLTGAESGLRSVGARTWIFLVLSGLATGASWLCYFRALQLGDVNKVVPVDKSSTILTILLAAALLGEGISWVKALAVAVLAAGTALMISKRKEAQGDAPAAAPGNGWLFFAALSAVFASLTAILGKIGIEGVDSNLGTAIRTAVVLVMAWLVVLAAGRGRIVREIPRNEFGFLCLSGLATGASWLCYYKALQDGPASVVVPIDKLSILVTVAFSAVVFKERLTRKAAIGLALVVAGTLGLLIRIP